MRRFNLLLACMLLGHFSWSGRIDSLQTRLTSEKNSKEQVKLQLIIGEETPIMRTGYWDSLARKADKCGEKNVQAQSLNNVGYMLTVIDGKHAKGLENYYAALKIFEKTRNYAGMGSTANNIGYVFSVQENHKDAITYYEKSLQAYRKTQAKGEMANVLLNLANKHYTYGDKTKALPYYNEALKIYEDLKSQHGIANAINSMGFYYQNEGDEKRALEYFMRGKDIREEIGDNRGLVTSLCNVAGIYLHMGQPEKGIPLAKKAYLLGRQMKFPEVMGATANCLYQCYAANGNYREALDMYKIYVSNRDSIYNLEGQKSTIQQKAKYDFEKREDLLKAEQRKKSALDEAENQKQKIVIYIVSVGLLLMLILAFVIWRNLKANKEKNIIINKQKILVEEKQKEIIDSINYAKRLQQAILATPEEIKKYLPQMFLYYQPKDIVAGDFYFFETTPTHIFIAAADCTGHGVPGAMVSVVCSNALTRCVKEFNLTDPGKILDKASELVTQTFEKSGADVKDGMDISLLVIARRAENGNKERDKNSLPFSALVQWAGANTSLWYKFNNEMVEIKPTKRSVGRSENLLSFSSHNVTLSSNTVLYLFTDGYADQFGGEKGKKFKTSNLVNMLNEISAQPLDEQKNRLLTRFENWRGNLEQIDDVCIIGIRI